MPVLPDIDCTGCSTCVVVCPVKAITMVEDAEGFLRPQIESSKCIECGKCEKCCPINSYNSEKYHSYHDVYAAVIKDEAAHKRSQSGGVFYALACRVLEKNGVVYGAAQDQNFDTRHIRVSSITELKRLQGVKYVQSVMGDTFFQVGEDLRKGLMVLFSGTPCQVAGLQSYLQGVNISSDRLLLADLVCYGVPSPGVFAQWKRTLEKAYKAEIVDMQYRRTDSMWGQGKEQYCLHNGEKIEGAFYTKLFFNGWIIRPSCENCRFCNGNRVGDVTLGDFWGIRDVMPEFYNDRGVSLIICNTDKGKEITHLAEDDLDLRESTFEAASKAQPRLRGIPVERDLLGRERFWEMYRSRGMKFIAMEENYIPREFLFRLEKKIGAIFRRRDR